MSEFNHILNALPWPSLLVGPDLRVGKFNSAAQSMFELAGSKTLLVNIMRHPNVLQAVDVSLNAQIEQKTRYVQRKIEGETVFKVHISPVDPIAGVMVCFENIQAAELLNQQRRDFVANVSHELRSPLTVMIGVLETLQGPAKADPLAHETFLGIMATEADRMRILIKDLLALSQVEDVQRQRPQTEICITTVIKQACGHVEQAMQVAGVQLTSNAGVAQPPVLGDVLNAYVARNTDLALAVRLRDHTVDQMYNGLFREILTHMMEDPRKISTCMHLHFIAKNVERMGDHVTNIAEQVIYSVSGELPEDARPKGNLAVADDL